MQDSPTPSFWPISKLPPVKSAKLEDLWRSLYFFGLYRLIIGGIMLLLAAAFATALTLDLTEQEWVFRLCLVYIFLTLLSLVAVQLRRPGFSLQLGIQVGTDIAIIATLSYFTGGIQGNLGMLLLVTLAAAGLISRGRITLFYAALASIAILLGHSYSVLTQEAAVGQFLQAGILSASYFAVAWLSHTLSKYAVASEKLAFVRGVDLSNMAEANRLMIQDMPDGVLVVDERGLLRQSNPSAERLLGINISLEIENKLNQISPLLDAIFAAWRQNNSLGREVLRLPKTNRLVRVRFLPVQREGFWGAVIVLEDMQRVQEQAQQVKLAALGRLTANIAHEVRNPLSSISYAAELLQEGQSDPAQLRLTRIILDNSARLNRIVQDVMQLNKRDRIVTQALDLNAQLHVLINELCSTQRITNGVITLQVADGCSVLFDAGHLQQVLWNLCNNALRYCQNQPGSVQLSCAKSAEGRVILSIKDDGPGISVEAAQKLFEPFFTTASVGTGLGLYIARELCEANAAVLEYQQEEHPGACFRIIFGVNHES